METYNCGTSSPPFSYAKYHFDYGWVSEDCDGYGGYYEVPSGWYNVYKNGRPAFGLLPGSAYPHTVYAHPFKTASGKFVMQYWFFYPFNDAINNHEGDWEHINVEITSDNPATAGIVKVVYYFHHNYIVCDVSQLQNPSSFEYYVTDDTHPVVFVGGYSHMDCVATSGDGSASHGSYSRPGIWEEIDIPDGWNLEPVCDFHEFTETTNGAGEYVGWCEFVAATADNKYGVVLLKEPGYYNYDDNPSMSWLQANLFWGHIKVRSMGTNIGRNDGNVAAVGPVHQGSWNNLDQPFGDVTLRTAGPSDGGFPWTAPSRDLIALPINGSTVSGVVDISGTAVCDDDSIVIDWGSGATPTAWHVLGVNMSSNVGPFEDAAYATVNSNYMECGTRALRTRTFSNSVQIAQETIQLVVEDADVVAPTSTVLAPNGGQTFQELRKMTIQWHVNDECRPVVYCTLLLDKEMEGGTGVWTIAENRPVNASGIGSYTWTIPIELPGGDDFRVRVIAFDVNEQQGVDVSDAYFTIESLGGGDGDWPPVPCQAPCPGIPRDEPTYLTDLLPVSPNPFNPETRLRFTLEERLVAKLRIYDVQGRLVRTMVDGVRDRGLHDLPWDGSDDRGRALPSGVYFVALTTEEHSLTRKLVILR